MTNMPSIYGYDLKFLSKRRRDLIAYQNDLVRQWTDGKLTDTRYYKLLDISTHIYNTVLEQIATLSRGFVRSDYDRSTTFRHGDYFYVHSGPLAGSYIRQVDHIKINDVCFGDLLEATRQALHKRIDERQSHTYQKVSSVMPHYGIDMATPGSKDETVMSIVETVVSNIFEYIASAIKTIWPKAS